MCLLLATYFLVTAAFALANAEDFAAELPQFLRYVAVPGAIGLSFALCAFIGSQQARTTVASAGLAVLGGMFAFEIMMTMRTYQSIAGMVATPEPNWMRARQLDESLPPSRTAGGVNAALKVQNLSGALLGGIPDERVLLCEKDGKPIIYQADRYGFNNPAWAYNQRPDIMVLGDSFVEGICLRSGEDMVSELRKSDTATVGLGSRGTGPLFKLATLGRYGPTLRPRTVVVAFFEGNDWENLEVELTVPYLRQALNARAGFGATELPQGTVQGAKRVIAGWHADTAPDLLDVLARTESLRNFLALSNTALSLGLAYPKAAPDIPEYARILAREKQIAATWGGRVMLLYIPRRDRYFGLIKRDFVYDQIREKVLAAAGTNGIPVVDLTELFAKVPDPTKFYALDAHFSEQGAEFAANAVLAGVRSISGDTPRLAPASNRVNAAFPAKHAPAAVPRYRSAARANPQHRLRSVDRKGLQSPSRPS